MSVLLPAFGIFEFKASQKVYFGAEFELTGESYRSGNSVYKNSFISNFGENKLTFLIKSRLFIDLYVTKNIVIYLKPGIRMFQKYEQFTVDDQMISAPDLISRNLKTVFTWNQESHSGLDLMNPDNPIHNLQPIKKQNQ